MGPNEGFMDQLAEYEPIYKAAQISKYSDRIDRPKRKFDELELDEDEFVESGIL